MKISKRWRLAKGGGWQEIEVGKRWRLARAVNLGKDTIKFVQKKI